jgi:hypothetical protein
MSDPDCVVRISKEELDLLKEEVRVLRFAIECDKKYVGRLIREHKQFREALAKIENDSAWNDPAWRVAHEALKDEE